MLMNHASGWLCVTCCMLVGPAPQPCGSAGKLQQPSGAWLRWIVPSQAKPSQGALTGMLEPAAAADAAFCVHPAALDATLHLLGAAAQPGQPQPLRIPASMDGVLCQEAAAGPAWPVAQPLALPAGGAMHACHRMLGSPGVELGLLVAKEVAQQLPQQPSQVPAGTWLSSCLAAPACGIS